MINNLNTRPVTLTDLSAVLPTPTNNNKVSQQSRNFDATNAIAEYQLVDESELAKQIVQAVKQEQLTLAAGMLCQLAKESSVFPQSWLLKEAEALVTRDWSLLSEGFAQQEFVGLHGEFLLIAPYRICREANESIELTAIYGQLLPIPQPPIKQLENLIQEIFGTLRQSIPLILPFNSIATCGNVGGESGEAFIVPDAWYFPSSFRGPALNDMKEQRRRTLTSGQNCIRQIFEPETAVLILGAVENEVTGNRNRHLEYQIHDAGHATGLGLDLKIQRQLFPCYWYGSVEEWRADGVEFELAAHLLTPEEAGQLIAVNLYVRFGLDAHRRGGPDRDADVNACLLTLDSLFQSGALYITKNGQLGLRNPSYQGLLAAVEHHRAEAVCLTRRELTLNYPTGIFHLYGSIEIQPSTQEIFLGLVVESCQGIWKALR